MADRAATEITIPHAHEFLSIEATESLIYQKNITSEFRSHEEKNQRSSQPNRGHVLSHGFLDWLFRICYNLQRRHIEYIL